jgi:16S rRNA processing protein RimM
MTREGLEYLPHPAAGSSEAGEPVFIVVGRLRRPHGIAGEMILEIWSDFPERLRPGKRVYAGEERQPLHILRLRPYAEHENMFLITFQECQDREQTDKLRNALVYVRADEIPPLPEGEYYHHQIVGLRVITDDGRFLGRVSEIIETAAHDVFVVRTQDGAEVLLPVVDEVILEINLASGEMRVHLLQGLI